MCLPGLRLPLGELVAHEVDLLPEVPDHARRAAGGELDDRGHDLDHAAVEVHRAAGGELQRAAGPPQQRLVDEGGGIAPELPRVDLDPVHHDVELRLHAGDGHGESLGAASKMDAVPRRRRRRRSARRRRWPCLPLVGDCILYKRGEWPVRPTPGGPFHLSGLPHSRRLAPSERQLDLPPTKQDPGHRPYLSVGVAAGGISRFVAAGHPRRSPLRRSSKAWRGTACGASRRSSLISRGTTTT